MRPVFQTVDGVFGVSQISFFSNICS